MSGNDDDEDWSEEMDGEGRSFFKRTIRSVDRLTDVSPVLAGAYKATSVKVV